MQQHAPDYSIKLVVALWQTSSVLGDKKANIDKLAVAAAEAAANGANLIAVPELYTTGYYNFSYQQLISMAETSNGDTFQQMSKIASTNNISIVYGYIETDNAKHLYDSAVLVSYTGERLINYRKVHVDGIENYVFTCGEELGPVVELLGVRIGLLICADVSFPEAARVLALQDADFIIIPTAQAALPEFNGYSNATVPSRANENILYVAYVNYVQETNYASFHGLSRLSDPVYCSWIEGSTDKEELLYATLYPATWRPYRTHGFSERHPECYGLICETTLV